MKRNSQNEIMNSLQAITLFRGIYRRVAKRLDVDPSYVSRVARGERRAAFVTEALEIEIRRALGMARLYDGRSIPVAL
jgi:transcriptional regulator with XRE-family HTH domain